MLCPFFRSFWLKATKSAFLRVKTAWLYTSGVPRKSPVFRGSIAAQQLLSMVYRNKPAESLEIFQHPQISESAF